MNSPRRSTTDCDYENFETEGKAIGALDRDSQIIILSAPEDSSDLFKCAVVRAAYGR
jgi:hypothetical protein